MEQYILSLYGIWLAFTLLVQDLGDNIIFTFLAIPFNFF